MSKRTHDQMEEIVPTQEAKNRAWKIRDSPVPKTNLVRLRYADNWSFNPGIGTAATALYRANSMYDPDYSGAGHQPMGFDQWMFFYEHYRVVGSKISVTFFPTDKDCVVGIYLDDDTTALGSVLSTTLEQANTRHKYLAASADRPVTVTHTFSAKKFYGKAQSEQSTLMGSASADCSEVAFFHIFAQGVNGADDPGQINVQLNIEYAAVLSEAKTLAAS